MDPLAPRMVPQALPGTVPGCRARSNPQASLGAAWVFSPQINSALDFSKGHPLKCILAPLKSSVCLMPSSTHNNSHVNPSKPTVNGPLCQLSQRTEANLIFWLLRICLRKEFWESGGCSPHLTLHPSTPVSSRETLSVWLQSRILGPAPV